MDASAWVPIYNYELHNNIFFADVDYNNIPKSQLLQLFWDLQCPTIQRLGTERSIHLLLEVGCSLNAP